MGVPKAKHRRAREQFHAPFHFQPRHGELHPKPRSAGGAAAPMPLAAGGLAVVWHPLAWAGRGMDGMEFLMIKIWNMLDRKRWKQKNEKLENPIHLKRGSLGKKVNFK